MPEEIYSAHQFYNACEVLLGNRVVNVVRQIPTSRIPYLCDLVAQGLLLGELISHNEEALNIVKVTATNLWRKDGCHGLS
jgi:hypothetical protein